MDMLLRRPRRRPCLIGLAGLSALAIAATPVAAQQVTAAQGSVTIDLGVLNQLGAPSTPGGYYPYSQAPGYAPPAYGQSGYGQSAYGQPAYAQPAYSGYNPYPTQATGNLLYPPTQNPVSTLTVPPPPGSTPYVPEQPAATASTANVAANPPPPPSPPPTPAEATNQGTATAPAASTEATASTAETTTGQGATGTAAAATGTSTETTAAATSTGTSAAPAAPAAPAVPAVPAAPAATEQSSTAATGAATGSSTATTAATTGQTTTASAGTQATETPAAPVEGQLQIAFPKDSADIPDAAKSELDSLAEKMTANEAMRIQLLAYASGTPDTASRARRMSLSRALAVRSYLIHKGVVSTRMDVRALGSNVQGEPADRVDILPKAS